MKERDVKKQEIVYSDVKKFFKENASKLGEDELYEILKPVSFTKLKKVFTKRKREYKRKTDKLETYIETLMLNYYYKTGEILGISAIKNYIVQYFKVIPVKTVKSKTGKVHYSFPKRIEKKIYKVYRRVKRRIRYRESSLTKKRMLEKLNELVLKFDMLEDLFSDEAKKIELEALTLLREVESYLTLEEKRKWKDVFLATFFVSEKEVNEILKID